MTFSNDIQESLQQLSKLNNYRGLLGVLSDWTVITISIYISIYFDSFFIYLLSIIVIGARQKALATLLHESAHRVLAKNTYLNDFIGKYLCGFFIFQTFKTYAKSHVIMHHNFLGNKDNDPDFKFYIASGLYNSTVKPKFVLKFLIAPFFLTRTPSYIKYLIVNRLGNYKDREVQVLIVFWVGLVFTCTYFGLLYYLILYWIVPLITVFPIIGWFVEMSEHYPIIENKDSIDQTRNRFSSPIEVFLTGLHAENYHLTHHLNTSIPYWNLSKAHKVMMRDPEYFKRNIEMGGIFHSSNKNDSVIQLLLKDKYERF